MKIKLTAQYKVGDLVQIKNISPVFVFQIVKLNVNVDLDICTTNYINHNYDLKLVNSTFNIRGMTNMKHSSNNIPTWNLNEIKEEFLSPYINTEPQEIDVDIPFEENDILTTIKYSSLYVDKVIQLDNAIKIIYTSPTYFYIEYYGSCIFSEFHSYDNDIMKITNPCKLEEVNLSELVTVKAKEHTSASSIKYFLTHNKKEQQIQEWENFFKFAGIFPLYEKLYNDFFKIKKEKIDKSK